MNGDEYDEALDRFHRTGPEFHGWLSNHGPMAADALVRVGHGDDVETWSDRYLTRLEDVPQPTGRSRRRRGRTSSAPGSRG